MSARRAPAEPAVEGLKAIAEWLGEFWGRPGPAVEVSVSQVYRALRRRHDPLPTRKPLGKRYALAEELQAWAARQGRAQVAIMLGSEAPNGQNPQRA